MINQTACREAFEAWIQTTQGWKTCKLRGKPFSLRQHMKGDYADFRVNDRWFAFQAAWNTRAPEGEAVAFDQRWVTDGTHPEACSKCGLVIEERIAWEATTPAYIKFITQSRYEKFSPAVRRWYKPYRCSNCDTHPRATPDEVERDAADAIGEPIDLPWISSALGWIERDNGFSSVTRRIAAGQRKAIDAALAKRGEVG